MHRPKSVDATRLTAAAVALAVALGTGWGGPAAGHAEALQGTGAQAMTDVDRLLAPIALYPDALLAQMLMCATDPASVTSLNAWLAKTQKLKGSALQDAAGKAGFEPSFVAMTLFPDVVKKMADQLDWTTQVGQVFNANRTMVFDSIQKLRHQAHDVGTLKTTPQQEVQTETTSSGQEVIVIESSNPQIVYVPQYNPTVVYTTPPPTTVVVENNSADAAVAGMIGFTAGIAIGAAVNNSYYYGPYGYHGGGYMYNDAWDDYYDHREDAREDWMDHREDMGENRREMAEERGQNRKDNVENRSENRGERSGTAQANSAQRQSNRQANGTAATGQRAQSASATPSSTSRGYSQGDKATRSTSSGSDAFSGYSSGKSERAASSRGQQSRSRSGGASRGGGGRRR
jgi:hypothetical protein